MSGRRLSCQVDTTEVEFFAATSASRYSVGSRLTRASCDRSSFSLAIHYSAPRLLVCQAHLANGLFDGPIDELNSPCDRALLLGAAVSGGFPQAVSRSSARRRSVVDSYYMQAIMQRDVRD